MKWNVGGTLETFAKPAGRSNGLYFDDQGRLLACADERNQLWRFTMDGQHEVLLSDYQGKLLNGPNDLWIRPDGQLYFTDPFYRRNYWDRGPAEQDVQGVYFFDPASKAVRRGRR